MRNAQLVNENSALRAGTITAPGGAKGYVSLTIRGDTGAIPNFSFLMSRGLHTFTPETPGTCSPRSSLCLPVKHSVTTQR